MSFPLRTRYTNNALVNPIKILERERVGEARAQEDAAMRSPCSKRDAIDFDWSSLQRKWVCKVQIRKRIISIAGRELHDAAGFPLLTHAVSIQWSLGFFSYDTQQRQASDFAFWADLMSTSAAGMSIWCEDTHIETSDKKSITFGRRTKDREIVGVWQAILSSV